MPTPPRLLDPGQPNLLSLAVLAVLFTLLNALKPLQVDDGAYYYFARQAAWNPQQPYGFDVFWYSYPIPAMKILAPPLVPYWWSFAIVFFGDNVFLWKLWLLPFSLLLVWSLAELFGRFARGLQTPLVWLTVLSPTFLPSLNLMLDVPSLALGLAATALFMRAASRDSFALAALAGLPAALSMQAKYSGFLFPVVILIYGLLLRRKFLALTAALVAGLLFASWELYVFAQHGQSHFLFHAKYYDNAMLAGGAGGTWWEQLWRRIDQKSVLAGPLLPILGGVSPTLILLGVAALPVRRILVGILGIVIAAGFAAVAALPGNLEGSLFGPLRLEMLIFGAYGVVLFGTMLGVLGQLFAGRAEDPTLADDAGTAEKAGDWFLLLWLGVELAGYFVLVPFPAVRRVMGLVVVLTLLAGRLAARGCPNLSREVLVRAIAVGGIALGLLYYLVDLSDALAQKNAAEQAAALIRRKEPDARIWYVGHWGFQHYAERAGMKPVVPGGYGRIEPSRLAPGDWLVKPDGRLHQQRIRVDPQRAIRMLALRTIDLLPLRLRTVQPFYGGSYPLEHHEGPRVVVEIYRVAEEWVPWRYP